VKWIVRLSRQAIKDAKKLAKADYKAKAEKLLKVLEINPLPSCLMLYNDIKPLHVVLSYNETNHKTYIITAYQPDLIHFEADFKTRRQQ